MAVDSRKIDYYSVPQGGIPASDLAEGAKTTIIMANDAGFDMVGITAEIAKLARFIVDSVNLFAPSKIKAAIGLKSSVVTATASCEFYIDSEVSPRLTLSTTATTESKLAGSFSVSGLTDGIHTLTLKVKSSGASDTATLELTEIYMMP